MALQITYEQIPNLSPEQSNFLKKANASISEIAHSLLAKYSAYKDIVTDRVTTYPTSDAPIESTNITSLVDDFVELKKVQFSNVNNISFTKKINSHTKKLFSKINATQLKRILSNIANNAVEAIAAANREQGIIEINLDQHNHFIAITISDNGCGMSKELINKLGTQEFSENKKGGHGIGLFSAIKQIKLWHGNYKIASEINQGTKFSIFLPIE
jgi:sensor histidine kinase regulating citrate/malate metabolism